MKHFKRRRLFCNVLLGTGARITNAPAMAQVEAELCVPVPPPPLRVEVTAVLRAERVQVERPQPGHWRWNGHEHAWIGGICVSRPRPRAEWIAGRREQRPRGWVFVDGHWN